MGMSMNVIGFKPKNEKYYKMKAISDACENAGIECPKQVQDYFESELPDDTGIKVNLPDSCQKQWSENTSTGIEIDIEKLPPDVTIIRFVNSW